MVEIFKKMCYYIIIKDKIFLHMRKTDLKGLFFMIKGAKKSAEETKTTAVKTDAKPATKKTAAKKPAAKTAAAKTAKAPKAAKTAAKTTKTAKTAKTTKTAAAKSTAAKKAPAKRAAKVTTIETVCKKIEKKISKTKAAAVKEKIAVDIEVWGFEDGSNGKMYIEVNNGVATVSPHTYEAKDFRISVSYANAAAFIDGKLSLKALVESKDFYAEGNIAAAVKLASIF